MASVPRCIALLAATTLLIAGCGVRLQDLEPGTEFWASIEITGTFTPDSPLHVEAQYEQLYPVDVDVLCELRREKEQLLEIGRATVPALAGGNPAATPIAGTLSYDFSAPPAPGTYVVECLTPLDEDNFIGDEITIGS